MNSKRKFFVALLFTAITLIISTAAVSAETLDTKMTAGSPTTITYTWNTVTNAANYVAVYYEETAGESNRVERPMGTATSCTIAGAATDSFYHCGVYATDAKGVIIASSYYRKYATTPGQIKNIVAYDWGRTKTGYFKMKKNNYPNAMYAVEWQLLDRKGKKVKAKGTTYSSSFTAGVPLNQVYKLKVRGCINVSGTYFYGPWYTKVVVPQPQMNDLKVASGTRIKISWKKVAGATKYIVYGSTSPKKGYKKISTLSSKKTSFIATYVNKKRIKRYKNYYFKVQAVKNKTKSLMTNFKGGQIYTRYY